MAEAGIVDIGVNINGVDWSLTAVSGLILGIRLYVKLARRRGLWWDDYLLLASWVSVCGRSLLYDHRIDRSKTKKRSS